MKKSRKKCWILQKSGLRTFIFTVWGFSTNWQILLLKRGFPLTCVFLGPKNCWRRSACNSKNDFLWGILDLENNFSYDLFFNTICFLIMDFSWLVKKIIQVKVHTTNWQFFFHLLKFIMIQVWSKKYFTTSNFLGKICILLSVHHCAPQVRSC